MHTYTGLSRIRRSLSERHGAEESSQEQPRESGQRIELEAVDSLICPVVKRQISLDAILILACCRIRASEPLRTAHDLAGLGDAYTGNR